jgi:hypothetical protein
MLLRWHVLLPFRPCLRILPLSLPYYQDPFLTCWFVMGGLTYALPCASGTTSKAQRTFQLRLSSLYLALSGILSGRDTR